MVGGFQCNCSQGFEGQQCDQEIDECQSQPCHNGGTCHNLIANFSCQCPVGFEGEQCEHDIDECLSNPCLNGGTCDDRVGTFHCQCVAGYEGNRCETDIDECASNPCLNNGLCKQLINSYECDCSHTGFEGFNCENNINDCAGDPCDKGAKYCEDQVLNYTCHCFKGFTGRHCEIGLLSRQLIPEAYAVSLMTNFGLTRYRRMRFFSLPQWWHLFPEKSRSHRQVFWEPHSRPVFQFHPNSRLFVSVSVWLRRNQLRT